MAIICSNDGEKLWLDVLVKNTTRENLQLRLYTNSYTPVATSTAANFTEATVGGYTAGGKTLTNGSWTSSTTVSGKASSDYAAQTWTFSGSQNILGYYVVGSTSGTLYFAELFASARSVVSGDTLTITPTITLNSES